MKNLYPVFLDINTKRCVVVGGGHVAERRVKSLLECGAMVKIISPELSLNLELMAEEKLIEVVKRDFCSGDLEGAFLAIAASDKTEVNRSVVEEARRRELLVDSSTEPTEGNFILPSVVRSGGLAIAISTSGGSPTLARMIREELEQSLGPEHATLIKLVSEVRAEFRGRGKQIPFEVWRNCIDPELLGLIKESKVATARKRLVHNLESGERQRKVILVVGANHKTAPIEVREKLALIGNQLERAHHLLTSCVDQGVILSTCNRSEVYALVSDSKDGTQGIKRLFSEWCGVSLDELSSYLYAYLQEDAVRHLFKVSSGLDSMILGDEQIRGQVRQALKIALAGGSLKHPLLRLFQQSLRVGRQVRNEGEIGKYGASVSRASVALAREVFGEIRAYSVLIIGAGQTGRLTAKAMTDSNVQQLTIISRTSDKATALAERFNANAATFDQLTECLANSDIVVSSTGASGFMLGFGEVKQAMQGREHRPLLLIDIAVPRDIDPAVKSLENVSLYDIDDLEVVSVPDPGEKQKKLSKAEAVIDSEVAKFMEWWRALEVVPTIIALRGRAEDMRQKEVDKNLGRMPELSEEERTRIEALTRAIVNKILHHPTVCLKDKNSGQKYQLMVEELFALEDGGLNTRCKK
ncbi:MAG: glutamyl-tRNA reductase [Dehalococcoidia bacterium]|nr:Glutamyl-tRNA reductase [Chloroflexota bacterium]MBT9159133.1 Glutamyl-tRNA reductase [Chloroflexota bacterium]